MSTGSSYSPAALDYFRDHGIAPEIAAVLGIEETDNNGISIPYKDDMGRITYRRRRDFAAKKTLQPKGQSLEPWTPMGDDGVLLVCEGESDCMAAISAVYEIDRDLLADPDVDPVESLSRRRDLPPPLQGIVPIAIPGAGVCHDHIATLAERLVADVWIVLDGDSAGRLAAKKLKAKIDAKEHVSAGIIDLPDDLDLSDVLAAADDPTAALAELVSEAEAAEEEVPVEGDGGDDSPKVEPLPPESITGLLEQVTELLDRYVILPGEPERVALVLFAAHSHAIEGAHATPYMLVVSPEKRSGKSRLLGVLELVVARAWGVIGASEAAMFRKIAKDGPTLLLDEIDAIFGSHSERTEPLRAILNAGNRPGATVARCVGENKDVEDFPIFCAKVLAGIDGGNRIPDTVRDRAVTIHMQRKTGAELVERFRHRVADAEAKPVRTNLERWAVGACNLLLDADPDLPMELDDRAAEAWEPLFAIADLAGGDWPERARTAAIALSSGDDRDETTTGTMLLAAIRDAFNESDRMASANLLDTINGSDELPFGGWRDGKGLDGRLLAKLLKPYGVKPRSIRISGEVAKGYLREQFEEVWQRWLPSPDIAVTSGTSVTGDDGVTGNPHQQADVTDVTDVTAQSRNGGLVTATEDEEAEAERLAEKFEAAV